MAEHINYQEARERCMEIIQAINTLHEHPAVRTTKDCTDRADSARQAINEIYMLIGAEAFLKTGKM